ncbi:hypothetical protein CPB85DRAFT_66576 [Mucidula mucida]|nr:hypothetical protein CPB85DRAFT_66576 [Mucidula mucida]
MDQTELSNASTKVESPPINALPHELFSHILFCCCEATSPGQDLYDLLSSITAVCRHWRDVAIASSELWTKIAFGQDSYIRHTARFLERSTSRLITVHVNITPLSSFVHSKFLWAQYNLISPGCERSNSRYTMHQNLADAQA